MGRIIIADDSIQKYIVQLQEKCQRKMGIIIGQVTSQKDFALALTVTPDDEADGAKVVEKAAREPGKEHGRKTNIDLNNIDAQWLATHAQQVNRMLVGGLDVIGVFVSADQDALVESHDNLKQSLYAVFKRLRKSIRRPPESEYNTDRLLLMINTVTKKVMCRTYDITDYKCQSSPGDWKYQSLHDKWIQLNSQLTVNIDLSFDKSLESQMLNKKIQSSISPLCSQIERSQATLNNQICSEPDLPLQTSSKSSLSKSSSSSVSKSMDLPRDLTKSPLNIDLFTDFSAIRHSMNDPIKNECSSKLSMYGTICGRAYVHSRATFTEAINAMKMDLIRSLMARCELLSEDIEITEGESTYMQFYKPPSRVFAKPPSFPVDFCDYVFADEEPVEVVERLSELLDIDVKVKHLELGCERYPADIDIPEPVGEESNTKMSGHSLMCSSRSHPSDSTKSDKSQDTLSAPTTSFMSSTSRFSRSRAASFSKAPSYTGRYIGVSAIVVAVIAVVIFFIFYERDPYLA